MSCVFSIFRRYFSFFKYFSFFLPSGPGSRHHTHRVPSMIMVITVGQHTNTRSSLNVKGDDSNQNQTVFFFFFLNFFSFLSSAYGLFLFLHEFSHGPRLALSRLYVCLPCLVLLLLLFSCFFIGRDNQKKKKKKLTTSLKFIFHYIYPVPGINTQLWTSKNRLSSHAHSSLYWNEIEFSVIYLFISCLNFISVCLHSIFGCWIVLWPVFRKASWN